MTVSTSVPSESMTPTLAPPRMVRTISLYVRKRTMYSSAVHSEQASRFGP